MERSSAYLYCIKVYPQISDKITRKVKLCFQICVIMSVVYEIFIEFCEIMI